MKYLAIISLLVLGGSAVLVEPPVEGLYEVTPIEVVPYEYDKTPNGLDCMTLSEVEFQWDRPQEHESWGTPLPEMDYCGYNIDGLRICCPK